MSAARKTTWAIRYIDPEEKPGDVPMYITPMDAQNAVDTKTPTGYGYCCGCKETRQFADELAAIRFMEKHALNNGRHKAIDSVTAAKEKAGRGKPSPKPEPPAEKPKSALTGTVVHW